MRITFTGHVGMSIETEGGSILCDPWFTPAYFASWFVFPRNDRLDVEHLLEPDYLYISHLHHDHFDPEFLTARVGKDATVLLPAFLVDRLEVALRGCGFTRFIHTEHGVPVDLGGGLEVTILAMTAPADGPAGDSLLVVADSTARVLNQNDARPRDAEELTRLGPFDAHFTQFSGAIWYPMVYDFPPEEMDRLGRRKREDQASRALAYITDVGAPHVFPCAGPPCFLDDDLWAFNDLDDDPANIFPDQRYFLGYLADHGVAGGELVVPGTVVTLEAGSCTVAQPAGDLDPEVIFADKRAHLAAYRADMTPHLEAARSSWPRHRVDVLAALAEWFDPLLEMAPLTRRGVGGPVLLRLTDEPADVPEPVDLVIDFPAGRVRAAEPGDEFAYTLTMDRALVEWCVVEHAEDWVNEIFLSCRFAAHRNGPYNEYIYTFFKCLSVERMAFCEGFYASRTAAEETFRCGAYEVQRRCPHLRADLARFGTLRDGHVLHCKVHGWEFDLESGRCLNADAPEHRIRARRVD
ncbi:MAG: Rieske 2Fe-2S domain-containing protein [Actinomycetes bacterium]